MKWALFVLSGFFFAASSPSWAFPEMIRHGYVSCTTCHYSPNGGRILTPYGRSLSREVLSAGGVEGEEGFLYGVLPLPEEVQLGGDVRALQIYRDAAEAIDARFFVMQAEVQAAVTVSELTAVASVGYRPEAGGDSGEIVLPEHYLMYSPGSNLTLRFGRFARPYGIGYAEHYLSIKRRLGLEREQDSYHFQAVYSDEVFELPLTATLGSLKFEEGDERGFTLRPALSFTDLKVGLSYSLMKTNEQLQHSVGPWFLLALSHTVTLAAELDYFRSEDQTSIRSATVGLVKATWEFYKGWHAFTWDEIDYDRDGHAVHRPAVGLQVFPRPHLDIQATYSKQFGARGFEQGLLLLHYYL